MNDLKWHDMKWKGSAMNEWMNQWMNEWMTDWMNEWMNEMNEWMPYMKWHEMKGHMQQTKSKQANPISRNGLVKTLSYKFRCLAEWGDRHGKKSAIYT
jgi:hypothetical protein